MKLTSEKIRLRMKKEIKINSSAGQNIRTKDTFKYKLLLEGIIVGAISGVLIACFRLLLSKAEAVRTTFVEWLHAGAAPRALVAAFALVVLAAIVALLLRWEPECSGSGIPQVEGELRGQLDMSWAKVIASKFTGCILAIGGGLALGREGPSVQLGAMVGKGVARSRHRLLTEERLLVTCGAGAGLSAAFGAPLAGAMFALEELHKTFSALVLITTMASAAISDWIASNIVGRDPVFNVSIEHTLPLKYYWTVVVLGLVLGVFGFVYNRTLNFMQDVFASIGSKVHERFSTFAKVMIMFALSLSMMYAYPLALGSGGNLVAEICSGKFALAALSVMILVKFIYSTGSFGSGAPGGIFLPLLVLGAITGGLASRALTACFGIGEQYITSYVIIAMAGMFAAIVRAPATGIILITEMTGSFSCLLALVTVSLISYITADALGGEPVYDQLWNRRIGKTRMELEEEEANRKTIIEGDIQMASAAENMSVEDLGLPHGSLIVALERNGVEIIPSGETKLKAGDHLDILCRKKDIEETERVLDEKCMHHAKGIGR